MSEKHGIKDLTELADLILELGMGIERSLLDGKVSLSDAFNFKDALFSVLPAIKGISNVEDEFFDLSEEEKIKLKAHIAAKLQLDASHESIEKISESILNIVIDMKDLIANLAGHK